MTLSLFGLPVPSVIFHLLLPFLILPVFSSFIQFTSIKSFPIFSGGHIGKRWSGVRRRCSCRCPRPQFQTSSPLKALGQSKSNFVSWPILICTNHDLGLTFAYFTDFITKMFQVGNKWNIMIFEKLSYFKRFHIFS